ncbi:MAG TPA: Sir2 family NAD-dependent protein deacetylase [Thermoanaerobaculia bacterium]|nr:Sir2 family NAD-dependent protein deacetylase [Thermoanaerobaculia bacterium]
MNAEPAPDSPLATAAPLLDALGGLGAGGLLVVTGAGVSAASGIPTFRGSDPGAIWKHDVTELGTRRYFEADPVGSWQWYMRRFDGVADARPNPAHAAIAELERWQVARGAPFLLVTQNVDTLHEQAGSARMVKVHGSADRVRCSREGCALGAPRGSLPRASLDLAAFRREPALTHLPRCPTCGALLRQHVLWFDETYDEHEDYQLPRVLDAAEAAAVVLFAGTSFSVGITDLLVNAAWRNGAEAFAIDPAAPPRPTPGVRHLRAAAEELLPPVVAALPRRPEVD